MDLLKENRCQCKRCGAVHGNERLAWSCYASHMPPQETVQVEPTLRDSYLAAHRKLNGWHRCSECLTAYDAAPAAELCCYEIKSQGFRAGDYD